MSQVSSCEIMSDLDFSSEDIMRLKVKMRRIGGIESVLLKKLEKLAS